MPDRSGAHIIEIKPFTSQTQADAIAVINAFTGGWRYVRPVDQTLLDHWKTIPSFQPEHFWIGYRDGLAQACVHAELSVGQSHGRVHLLALRPGALTEASLLLRGLEERARKMGLMQLTGPSPASALFYGGYILGSEPYHPHWAVEGAEAYVRAGYHITAAEVLMVRDLTKPIVVDEPAPGYDIVEAPDAREYGARAFGFLGMHSNHEIAYCYARLYPALIGPSGGAVGQIGGVATDEAHRGHGLARVMTQMCLRQLAAWGGAEAILSTGLNNGPALRAYERAGFERRHHACEWTRTL